MFWGDERFVPSDSADRNDLGGREDPLRRGPVLGRDAVLDAAVRRRVRRGPRRCRGGVRGHPAHAPARPDEGEVPSFDVALIGVGPDGHCCSLFPDHPSARDLSAPVIPVRESPKPPPLRLSLSFDALNTADTVWVVASGEGKADAVAAALAPDADRKHVPSAGAVGRLRTVWWVDAAAASKLA